MKEFILFTIEDTGKVLENIYSLFANTCIILDSIEYLQIYFFLAALYHTALNPLLDLG